MAASVRILSKRCTMRAQAIVAIAALSVSLIPSRGGAQNLGGWGAILDPYPVMRFAPSIGAFGAVPCGPTVDIPDTVVLAGPASAGGRFYGHTRLQPNTPPKAVEIAPPAQRDSLLFIVRELRCVRPEGPPAAVLVENRGRYLTYVSPPGAPSFSDLLAMGANGRYQPLVWSDEVRAFGPEDRIAAMEEVAKAAQASRPGASAAELESAYRVALAQSRGYSAATLRKVLAGEIEIGWSRQMVRDALGAPPRNFRVGTRASTTEIWVYPASPKDLYVHFVAGRVSVIQS